MNDKVKSLATTDVGPAIPQAPNRMLTASSQVRPLQLNSFEDMWRFAGALAKSGMLPSSYSGKNNPSEDQLRAKAMVALQLGAEVGLQPMQAIQSIYVVNGVPTLWGDGQLAIVRQSGQMESIKETSEGTGDSLVCTCEVKRKGEAEPTKRSFSWKDAQQAGLANKDTYKGHPKRMCGHRARTYALRDTFPDVLKGLTHTYEEMIDVTPPKEAVVAEVKPDNLASILAEETPAAAVDETATGGTGAEASLHSTEATAKTGEGGEPTP